MIGDRRKFLSALLVPDFDTSGCWARDKAISIGDRSELVATPTVRQLFEAEVATVNQHSRAYEQIQSWELLGDDFTIETGELTPTQKIKRRVIATEVQRRHRCSLRACRRGDERQGDHK